MRELAECDPQRAAAIAGWPLGEALHCFEQRLRARAQDDYRFALLLWSIRAQAAGKKAGRPPKLPAILRG